LKADASYENVGYSIFSLILTNKSKIVGLVSNRKLTGRNRKTEWKLPLCEDTSNKGFFFL
jgi:hypothetical protein